MDKWETAVQTDNLVLIKRQLLLYINMLYNNYFLDERLKNSTLFFL